MESFAIRMRKAEDILKKQFESDLIAEELDMIIHKTQGAYNAVIKAMLTLTDPENSEHQTFEAAAMPLIKYMAENHHPHTTAIVTNTRAELLEGIKTTGEILDFIKE